MSKVRGLSMRLTVTANHDAHGNQLAIIHCPVCNAQQHCTVKRLPDGRVETSFEPPAVCEHLDLIERLDS